MRGKRLFRLCEKLLFSAYFKKPNSPNIFGRPTKITVNTYAEKDGIINIERQIVQFSNIYDKGVLILSGYLGEKYTFILS